MTQAIKDLKARQIELYKQEWRDCKGENMYRSIGTYVYRLVATMSEIEPEMPLAKAIEIGDKYRKELWDVDDEMWRDPKNRA